MKRHRVRLRPKDRARRFLRFAVVILCAMAVMAVPKTVRRVRSGSPEFRMIFFPGSRVPFLSRALSMGRVDSFEIVGVPESVARSLREAMGWEPGAVVGPLEAYRMGRELLERGTCLREVKVRRLWLKHSLKFEATLRVPVARLIREGQEDGFLDDSGVLFQAPAGLWEEPLPKVDPGSGREQNLKLLARLLMSASVPGALPARLHALRWDDKEGWVGELEDQTRLYWGDLSWTDEKLNRLRQVLTDAAGRFGKVSSADLRDFEDGRILVRPRQMPAHG